MKSKIIRISGGVALAVIVLIILTLLFGAKFIKSRIEATASKALGMDVRGVGRPKVSFFPVFGASLSDVTVKEGGADVATIANVIMRLKLLPFSGRRIRMSRLELVKPAVSVVRQKNGKLNIASERGGASGQPVTVKKFTISQGSLVYLDLVSGGRIELEGIDFTAEDFSAGGAPGGDPLKTLSFTGEILCRTVKAGNITLTDLEMKVAGRDGVYDISQARAEAFGGKGSGTLHADFSGAEPQFKILLAVSRLKIGELLKGSPNAKGLEGLADLSADLTASGKNVAEVKRSLSGQASLNGENLGLNSMDLDSLILSLRRSRNFNLVDVGAFFLAGPLGPALTRGYHFADLYKESQGGKGVITKLVSVWKVGNGVAEAVDVAMATKKLRVAMKGGVNFIDNRFEDAVVAVLDDAGCAVITQKIRGPFGSPEIGNINILRSLTSPITSLVKSVLKLFGSGPCEAFYTGSVAPPVPEKAP